MVKSLVLQEALSIPSVIDKFISIDNNPYLEIANLINNFTGNQTPSIMKPRRDWDNSGRRFGSTAKSAREIEFSSKVNITDGLKETVDWFKDNFDLINNSINKHHNSLNKF